jgi:hypothetical protein
MTKDWTPHLLRMLEPLVEYAKTNPEAAVSAGAEVFNHFCRVAALQGRFEAMEWLRMQPGTKHLMFTMAAEVERVRKEMEAVGKQLEALGNRFVM